MKRIYIAGKITGEDLDKCEEKFNAYGHYLAESKFITKLSNFRESGNISFTHGFLINAHLIPDGTWEKYMKNDLRQLLLCDEIHMLPCWVNSKGAKIEHQLALDLGIVIKYI